MRSGILIVMLAGCGVRIDDGGMAADAAPNSPSDAPSASDASSDAPPPPPPCVEGEARMATPSGCFAAFLTTPQTRVDARATCIAAGMHLAHVRSAADEAVIAALSAGTDVAIGLDDLALEGTFVWDDGSPPTYLDWAVGEPNSGGGGSYEEDCVVYAGSRPTGQWDDRPCAPPPVGAGAYGFICQR